MRWKFPALALIIIFTSIAALTVKSQAQTVNIDLFYEELSPYGQWSPHPEFGDIWQPYNVGADWKPYTDGRWAWSDQGWIWISYEPWGWATYHYGRWIFDDYQGWIWIPGTTWAPAWVSWHQSPEYIGWSPLPPDRGFFVEIGFNFNFYKSNYYKPYYYKPHHHHHKHRHKKRRYYHDYYHNPHNYRPPAKHSVFLPHHKFGHHKHAGKAAIPPPHYDLVLRKSRNVTNIKRVNNKVINYGPDRHYVEKHSNRKLVKHKIVEKNNNKFRGRKNVNNIQNDSYNVYRPRIERGNRNPYITNRNQVNINSTRNKNEKSKLPKKTQLNKPTQNNNFKFKDESLKRYDDHRKRSGISKNYTDRKNSEIKKDKTYNKTDKKRSTTNKYKNKNDQYQRYGYKDQQQKSRYKSEVKLKNRKVEKKNVSTSNKNTKKYQNSRYQDKEQRSNKYNNPKYRQTNRSYNNQQKGVKNSDRKKYSNNNHVKNNKGVRPQKNSYKPKSHTAPKSTKPNFSKR